jgi:hypothetical protein
LELSVLDEAGRRKVVSRILAEWAGEWQDLIDAGVGDTPAPFQERCTRHALQLHYCDGTPHEPTRSSVTVVA